MLLHVAVSRQEKRLSPKVKGLSIHSTSWEKIRALFQLQVEVHSTLSMGKFKFHNFYWPEFVSTFHKTMMDRISIFSNNRSLPIGCLCLEKESLKHKLCHKISIKVLAVIKNPPKFSARHVWKTSKATQSWAKDFTSLFKFWVMDLSPFHNTIVNNIFTRHLEIIIGQYCLDTNKRKIQNIISEPARDLAVQ